MKSLVVCSNCERRIDDLEMGSAQALVAEKSSPDVDVRLSGCLQICARPDVIAGVNVRINDAPATVYVDDVGTRKIKKY